MTLPLPRRLRAAVIAVLAATLLAPAVSVLPVRAHADDAPGPSRLFGPSRIHTAVAVAERTDPAGAATVVLARADAYADALSGGPLAAKLGAPVLLTSSAQLDAPVAEAIRRLGATRVILLGGTSALTPAVERGVRAVGVATVERIAGPTRYDTAAEVAARVLDGAAVRRVYVTEGAHDDPRRGWPDALSASALAAADGGAILLTAGSSLPAPTAAALTRLQPGTATIVGGTAAVPAAVEQAVRGAVGTVDRASGPNRYATSASLAARAAALPTVSAGRVWLASGLNWPDALVAAPAAARLGGVLLLTDPASLDAAAPTREWFDRHPVGEVTLVGGAGSIGEQVAAQAAARMRTGAAPGVGATVPLPGVPTVPAVELAGAKRWSDAATWGGAKPAAGGTAVVPAGTTILLDEQPPHLRAIEVHGTLVLADRPMTIRTGSLMVHGRSARLVAGTPAAPLRSKVEIVLDGDRSANVHGMGANVLAAMDGGQVDLHGAAPAVPWTRLAATAPAGATSIQLAQPVDWRPGDEIVIASTSLDPRENERRTVAAVDGRTVHLRSALGHLHWGEAFTAGGATVGMQAEVGLLTRNLVVRGPDAQPDGFGGHTMAMTGGSFRASGVELTRLGQRGVNARYPIHFHLLGDAPSSWVHASSVHSTNQRCITIHGSSKVDLVGNVAYDAPGHCMFFEDGVEVGNRLVGNLVLGVRPPAAGSELLATDRHPAAYWLQHPGNHLTGNVAAASTGHGFWYDLPTRPTGLSATDAVRPREAAFGTFSGNVAHSIATSGEFKSGSGLRIDDYTPPSTASITGFVGWKNAAFGIWADRSPHIVVSDAVLAGNDNGYTGPGTTLRSATIVGATPNDATRPWVQTGLGFYNRGTDVDGVTFVGFARQGDRRHAAIGSIVHEQMSVGTIRRARFVDVPSESRVRVVPQWDDKAVDRTVAILDADGSVTGAPALLTSDHALLRVPGCTDRVEWRGLVCPATTALSMLQLADLGGTAKLGPVTVRRGDGATGPVLSDPSWSSRPLALWTARHGQTYTPTLSRATPAKLEVVLASLAPSADLRVRIPWPHATAHVYRGWGEWAWPLAVGDPAGADRYRIADGHLELRPYTDGTHEWSSWKVCAERGCGEGIGSKRAGY